MNVILKLYTLAGMLITFGDGIVVMKQLGRDS